MWSDHRSLQHREIKNDFFRTHRQLLSLPGSHLSRTSFHHVFNILQTRSRNLSYQLAITPQPCALLMQTSTLNMQRLKSKVKRQNNLLVTQK